MFRRLLISGVLVTVSSASSAHGFDFLAAETNAKNLEALRSLKKMLRGPKRVFEPQSLTQDKIDSCTDAFDSFAIAVAPCNEMSAILADYSGSDVVGAVERHCKAGGCQENVAAAISKVEKACVATDTYRLLCSAKSLALDCENEELCSYEAEKNVCAPNTGFWEQLRKFNNIPCVQGKSISGAEEYCLPAFINFINLVEDDTVTLQSKLQQGCSECTVKVLKILARVGDQQQTLDMMSLANMCLTLDDKYCAVHVTSLTSLVKPVPVTDSYMDEICHPCTWAYTRRILALKEAEAILANPNNPTVVEQLTKSYRDQLNLLLTCTTDLQDKFCWPQLAPYNLESDFSDANGLKCDVIDAFHSDVGCCANTLLNVAEGGCVADAADEAAKIECASDSRALKISIKQGCSSTWVANDGCNMSKLKLKGKAIVRNLRLAYYNTFKDEVRRKIVAALALNLGVEQAALRNVVINGDADLARRRLLSSNIEVTYELVVKSTQERDAAAAAVGVKGEEMFCYELCETSAADPTVGVSIINEGFDDDISEISGGSKPEAVHKATLLPLLLLFLFASPDMK